MKEEAIKLRQSGESIKVIAKKLGKAASTVHSWVKDIPLSDEINWIINRGQ
jgi:transposase-like protein